MRKSFVLSKFQKTASPPDQYQKQLHRLTSSGKGVDCIEQAVRDALKVLSGNGPSSFVIYGEPQSGKTEMMICLTARLLDAKRPFILHLLNDSVDLLTQNLGRFKASGLAPSARNFLEILDPAIILKKGQHVVFCKKNGNDLLKLSNKIGEVKNIIVIDDEADFASPNGKVNQAEKTKINQFIEKILGKTGTYIGVTATPARLDLNNTFANDREKWVRFPPHDQYTGQEIFFPFGNGDFAGSDAASTFKTKYNLRLLPSRGDDPKYAREALFRFLTSVAYLNTFNNKTELKYSMLVHTSGKKIDHKADWGTMQEALGALSDSTSPKFPSYTKEVWEVARSRFKEVDPDTLTSYVVDNVSKNSIIILNSDSDFRQNGASATNPTSLFTIVIGGNIVSRGVTFDNLLSMFFTRDVKHKIQQDTYIQRARMFGSRGKYISFFELTIPEALYADWHRCFVFHRLSLASIKSGKGSPVWLSDSRISAVAASSIDRSTVDIDRGEMAFALFDWQDSIDEALKNKKSNSMKLAALSKLLGSDAFPAYLHDFITKTSKSVEKEVSFQPTASVLPSMTVDEKKGIYRRQGLMGSSQTRKQDQEKHFLKIFRNSQGKARLFYKFDGSIQFTKNTK